jgi:hypothetical protein
MERKLVTCPETAHLEEVDYEPTPLGLLITGCSRFQPRCAVQCARECARRIDRRERAPDDGPAFDDEEVTAAALLAIPTNATP